MQSNQPWIRRQQALLECFVLKIANSDHWFRHVCPSFSTSVLQPILLAVRMEQFGAHWTDLHEIWCIFSKICLGNSNFINIWQRITGTLHEDLCTVTITFHWILLRMRNVLGKIHRENQNRYFMLIMFFSPENRAVYVIMWKNVVEPDRSQMAA